MLWRTKQIVVVNLFLSPKRKLSFNKLVARVKEAGAEILKADHQSLPDSDSSLLTRCDGIILSGTEALLTRTADRNQFKNLFEFLPKIEVPILGICGGHQALAIAYGGEVAKSGHLVTGFRTVELEDKDSLLAGLPAKIRVMQSHYEEVKRLPPKFVRIARSKDAKNEAMKHEQKPVYGVQFHPERWNEENLAGKRILENFIERIATKM
ncbi:MAG: gamma-glutamyl-gamma-aminobutyrate hydrolase family protein [Candidatus Bathyarchaeia archaeon]